MTPDCWALHHCERTTGDTRTCSARRDTCTARTHGQKICQTHTTKIKLNEIRALYFLEARAHTHTHTCAVPLTGTLEASLASQRLVIAFSQQQYRNDGLAVVHFRHLCCSNRPTAAMRRPAPHLGPPRLLLTPPRVRGGGQEQIRGSLGL